jgi:hypothetical protein
MEITSAQTVSPTDFCAAQKENTPHSTSLKQELVLAKEQCPSA